MAIQNSLALQQLDLAQQRTKEEIAIQKAAYLPTLSAVGGYAYTWDLARISLPFPTGQTDLEAGTRNRYDLSVGVDQPVLTGYRTRHLVAVAQTQLGSEKAQQVIAEQSILFQVGMIFYYLQHNRLQQEVLEQSTERAQVYANAAMHYGRPGVNAFRDQWMGYYTLGVKMRWQFWDAGQNRRKRSHATFFKKDRHLHF